MLVLWVLRFLSTLSLRRATIGHTVNFHAKAFLSTLSLRRATFSCVPRYDNLYISIHALLAESDFATSAAVALPKNFYPRSPCGERLSTLRISLTACYFYPRSPCGERLNQSRTSGLKFLFLSTLSLRRATRIFAYGRRITRNFYPRSPCGERLAKVLHLLELLGFLSTLSLRRATL